jgi:PleD family two-component response regulator
MSAKQIDNQATLKSCPAGDDKCTNLTEVKRLQEEIKQLAALVRTDELTRLFNFRYFNQALSLEMERTRRSGQPTCLIMLDLDHFKEVNDVYGHEAGNIVLRHISSLIRKTVRRLDIPCRYGGGRIYYYSPRYDPQTRRAIRQSSASNHREFTI